MDRLTDHDVAQTLRDNIAAGGEVNISNLIYIKLSDYEDEEELRMSKLDDGEDWYE